jgi:hypothetical protein
MTAPAPTPNLPETGPARPSYRNPHNDPPRLGEMIHHVDVTGEEYPGIISRAEERDRTHRMVISTIFSPRDPRVVWLGYDDYDPTPDPARNTWHFDHF